MPQIDMPLEELYSYKGTNPCPNDFDAYWERGLAEMREVKPDIKLEKAEFQSSIAECYHLTFTGVRNARIYAKLLKPKGKKSDCPALLLFHGYGWHSLDWAEKLAYVSEGFVVAAMDSRGQGGRSEDSGGHTGNTLEGQIVRGLEGNAGDMLMRHIMLDTAQFAGIVMAMDGVDPHNVMAAGGSQGGGLTLACAALEDRIKRAAPSMPFLSDYQRAWEMDLVDLAYHELKMHFRYSDPRHLREKEIFTKLGYIDVQHLAPRIKAEVLMAGGLLDECCPPSTQFAAYNKIKSKKDFIVYPDYGHEFPFPGWADLTFNFLTGR
jgi:cephalosporin-C deacetylase